MKCVAYDKSRIFCSAALDVGFTLESPPSVIPTSKVTVFEHISKLFQLNGVNKKNYFSSII